MLQNFLFLREESCLYYPCLKKTSNKTTYFSFELPFNFFPIDSHRKDIPSNGNV